MSIGVPLTLSYLMIYGRAQLLKYTLEQLACTIVVVCTYVNQRTITYYRTL